MDLEKFYFNHVESFDATVISELYSRFYGQIDEMRSYYKTTRVLRNSSKILIKRYLDSLNGIENALQILSNSNVKVNLCDLVNMYESRRKKVSITSEDLISSIN